MIRQTIFSEYISCEKAVLVCTFGWQTSSLCTYITTYKNIGMVYGMGERETGDRTGGWDG